MKNKDEAVKNGLKLYGNADAIKTWCLTCQQNAHGKTSISRHPGTRSSTPSPENKSLSSRKKPDD